MQALAAHGRDRGLAKLIAAQSPVYTNAVDIRTARSGDASDLLAEVREAIASGDRQKQLTAVDLAHFLPVEERVNLATPLVSEAAPGDELASKLLMLHLHAGHYEPALLPKLLPFLDGRSKNGSAAALHLALHGDAQARAEALGFLNSHGRPDANPQVVQGAFELLEHEDSRAGALEFLQWLRQRRSHFGRDNAEILDALAKHGDAGAADELMALAYGGDERDHGAVAGAVHSLAKRSAPIAFQAARRLFAASGLQSAARLLIETNTEEGLTELVQAYAVAPLTTRLSVARTLRWNGPSHKIVPALAAMAHAVDENMRKMAAELGGWMPFRWKLPFLADLASDPVRAVEHAAIDAMHRRASEHAAKEILAMAPLQTKPRQWVLLKTLIDLVDPHLLAHPGDPLAIIPLLEQLPAEFGIEAERLLKRRIDEVEKKAEREEARDR
jgi:HEAT repeat protein